MNRHAMPFIIGSLLLPLGCGGNDPTDMDEPPDMDEPLVLQPTELCSDNPGTAIATFVDANLETAIRTELLVGAQGDLTCSLISGLSSLETWEMRGVGLFPAGITSLVGIQNLTSLGYLGLSGFGGGPDQISDISPLSGLSSPSTQSATSARGLGWPWEPLTPQVLQHGSGFLSGLVIRIRISPSHHGLV